MSVLWYTLHHPLILLAKSAFFDKEYILLPRRYQLHAASATTISKSRRKRCTKKGPTKANRLAEAKAPPVRTTPRL
jgi:hypothetical protein